MKREKEEGEWIEGYIYYEEGYIMEKKMRKLMKEGRKKKIMCFGVLEGK